MKKFISIIIFFVILFNTNIANAEEKYNEHPEDYINEIYISKNTIDLANFYIKTYSYFKEKKVDPIINVYYSPNFKKSIVENLNKAYYDASSFWGVSKVDLFYFHENEIDWYRNTSTSIMGSYDTHWADRKGAFSSCGICAMATYHNNPQYYHVVRSTASNIDYDFLAHHESIHGLQSSIGLKDHPNCWFIEGQANALAFSSFIDYDKKQEFYESRKRLIGVISRILPNINKDIDIAVKEFENFQKNRIDCFNSGLGYHLGMLLVEYMYINYDIDLVHKMMKYASNKQSFSEATEKYLNITESEFYLKAFVYVQESIKEYS